MDWKEALPVSTQEVPPLVERKIPPIIAAKMRSQSVAATSIAYTWLAIKSLVMLVQVAPRLVLRHIPAVAVPAYMVLASMAHCSMVYT